VFLLSFIFFLSFLLVYLINIKIGYGTSFEPKALSWTVAPDTLRGFIAQRRRWDNSTLVNQIDLIFAAKESVFSLWGGRYTLPWVWNFIDFIFTLFMPGNMILLMVSMINSILGILFSHITIKRKEKFFDSK
jgi:cellulose synthase/poly-beta-1,6-N-acetylglucosamine synthase-like glycosyltransferase